MRQTNLKISIKIDLINNDVVSPDLEEALSDEQGDLNLSDVFNEK